MDCARAARVEDTTADPTATSAWAGHPGWRPRPGSTGQRTGQRGQPLAAWHASSAGTHGLSRGGRAGWAATGDGAVTPTLTSGPLGESVGQSQHGCGGWKAASLPCPACPVYCSPVPTSGPDTAPSWRGPASRGLDPPLRTGWTCSTAEPQLAPVQTWRRGASLGCALGFPASGKGHGQPRRAEPSWGSAKASGSTLLCQGQAPLRPPVAARVPG